MTFQKSQKKTMELNKFQSEQFIAASRDLLYETASKELLSFTRLTKPDYDVNWHHKELCKALNLFLRKKIRRLMVFMPPRHGKSELTSRRLPALIHGLYPKDFILAASYNGGLASDMCKDVQRIIDSEAYQNIFPHVGISPEGSNSVFKRSSNEHDIFLKGENGEKIRAGRYRCGGINGGFTGRSANWILVDDPFKNQQEADSPAFRKQVWSSFQSSLLTRLEGEGSVLITMTRWHEDDLCGRILDAMKNDDDADQYTVIDFPAIKEDETNPKDPRQLGEALWPEKFDEKRLMITKHSVGSRVWSALYQQKPTSEEGTLFPHDIWPEYTTYPENIEQIGIFIDCAQKPGLSNDYSVFAVWAKTKSGFYLLDLWRKKTTGPVLEVMTQEICKKWQPNVLVIEDKSAGSSLIQYLQLNTTLPIIPYNPKQDKVTRAIASTPTIAAGKCFVPSNIPGQDDNGNRVNMVNIFKDEHRSFPYGRNDDIVDTTSMMVDYFNSRTKSEPRVRAL